MEIPQQVLAHIKQTLPHKTGPSFLSWYNNAPTAVTCKESAGVYPYTSLGKTYLIIMDPKMSDNLPRFLGILALFDIQLDITEFVASGANGDFPAILIEGWGNQDVLSREITRFFYRDAYRSNVAKNAQYKTIDEFVSGHYLGGFKDPILDRKLKKFFHSLKATVELNKNKTMIYDYPYNGIISWISGDKIVLPK